MKAFAFTGVVVACLLLAADSGGVNSLGIRMIEVPVGEFSMGNNAATPAADFGQFAGLTHGDYDERPVHRVTLGRAFLMSEHEVTREQFEKFRLDHSAPGRFEPYVTGVSWFDAIAFCGWLSRKEKKTYRLPTEAEWEYAARNSVALGLKGIEDGPAEWVLDWHGIYPDEAVTDPVGPEHGFAKVIRGGGIMGPRGHEPVSGTLPYYRRVANRAGIAPAYRSDAVGFRIVQAAIPNTQYTKAEEHLAGSFVEQNDDAGRSGPPARKPWFRQRPVLPVPPETASPEEIGAAGWHPSFLGHNHSPGLVACPNGDLLAVFFSSQNAVPNITYEYLPDVSFLYTRLRAGTDEWDPPAPLYDFPDVNEQASVLWRDGSVLHHFSGGIGLSAAPFRLQTSRDNGATWSAVEFPLLRGPIGSYRPQPINTAWRNREGTIYLSSDGSGGESLLWASADGGVTWRDTGGRTGGRHTSFVELRNGCILGMGGKNTDIGGYMPQSRSCDGGKTWTVSATGFPAVTSNQRPVILRLQSGRLLFASDWQNHEGRKPADVTGKGSFVALSADEGGTWKSKDLPGVLPHESFRMGKSAVDAPTLGYVAAAQTRNGVIHLLTSMNRPAQHFELNESWILEAGDAPVDEPTHFFTGMRAWRFPSGQLRYSVDYRAGHKVGIETWWRRPGVQREEWDHRPGGVTVWTQFREDGTVRCQSTWNGVWAEGPALRFDRTGQEVERWDFRAGRLAR